MRAISKCHVNYVHRVMFITYNYLIGDGVGLRKY